MCMMKRPKQVRVPMTERQKAAEEALLFIMGNEKLADTLPVSVCKKIDKWYRYYVKQPWL